MATRPKTGGRKPGSKNKATIEKERREKLFEDNQRERKRLEDAGDAAAVVLSAGKIPQRKLMKEIAFDLAHLFGGLAAFYQPFPGWRVDENGRHVNANPNFNEEKFVKYAVLAANTSLGAASYESPKLSAVMVASAVVTEIEIIGGLPDKEDGSFAGPTIEGRPAAAAISDQSAGVTPDVPSEADRPLPDAGEAEGGALRKAVG